MTRDGPDGAMRRQQPRPSLQALKPTRPAAPREHRYVQRRIRGIARDSLPLRCLRDRADRVGASMPLARALAPIAPHSSGLAAADQRTPWLEVPQPANRRRRSSRTRRSRRLCPTPARRPRRRSPRPSRLPRSQRRPQSRSPARPARPPRLTLAPGSPRPNRESPPRSRRKRALSTRSRRKRAPPPAGGLMRRAGHERGRRHDFLGDRLRVLHPSRCPAPFTGTSDEPAIWPASTFAEEPGTTRSAEPIMIVVGALIRDSASPASATARASRAARRGMCAARTAGATPARSAPGSRRGR